MDYKANDVVKWSNPQNELEERDIMVVRSYDKGVGTLLVKHINESDGVIRESLVSCSAVEFRGICSEYEPYADIVRRHLRK